MSKASIFIVEDELIVADDLKLTLQNLGYTVTGMTQTGEIAIEQVPGYKPDLVLMDIQLGGSLDGIETADWIRTHLGIPVIFLTAHADDENLDRAKVTEPYGYIIKPYDERELRSVIEIALYKHRMEQQARENERTIRALANAIPDAVLLLDPEQKILALNDSMARRLGQSPVSLIGTGIRSHIPGGLPAQVLGHLEETIQMCRTVQYEENEGNRWFEVALSPIPEPGCEISRIMIQYHDITDFKLIEQRIRSEGITQIERNMEQFQTLNDQIRNPLQAITGYLELGCEQFKSKIGEQVLQIDNLVTRLDHGWVESEKVRRFLYRHYHYGLTDAKDTEPARTQGEKT
jgi:two-component system, response regulator PdtaR